MSFNVLMQNFYKVTQNNHEKVPSSATRLEGTLNQIRPQCPRRITDWEVQQHLKDHLFHGVCKHIRDSICYLYSNTRTTYSQLMLTAHKAESKNEEAWGKVWARSAITTKPVEGGSELGNQIARLMAALRKVGQGNSPSSTPDSPKHRGCGRGRMNRTTSSHPNPHNGWTGLGQTASAHSVSAGHGTGTAEKGQGNVQGPRDEPQFTSVFPMSRLGPYGSGVCHPSQIVKPDWGELRECSPTTPTAAVNSRPPAFPPWP